ncbi:hypothetical protein [Mesorhizobium sp.]|uniref:hypothetical protein n=1 Tax=Mesorhizobium sp. TaxID=1871066 RepID=UPI000FE464D5|nr:hypothetical protein [Mesorhizobium sp.]RWP80455.1 MAG: hypothetical protein EOR10_08400 [Mesorhizobium sp.]
MKTIRLGFFSLAISCLPFLFFVSAGSSQSEDSAQLDAVCKEMPVPPGFVAVGEMESVECKPSEPGQMNAWLIDRARSKIVSCIPPDYDSGYPPAISLMMCGSVKSAKCQPKLDGSNNAFELTTNLDCSNPRIRSECDESKIHDAKFEHRNFNAPFDPSFELPFFELSIDNAYSGCPSKPGSRDRVRYLQTLEKGEAIPLCMALNPSFDEMGSDPAPGAGRLQWHNSDGYNTKILIIRWFVSEYCPPYIVEGKARLLNAVVVRRVERDEWQNKEIFVCATSLQKLEKRPYHPIPGTGGRGERETAAERFGKTKNYEVKKILHDDRCGSGPGNNTYIVVFNSVQTPVLP